MGAGGWLRRFGLEASSLVWPRVCEVCGRRLTVDESFLCLHCELKLPLTHLHREPLWNEIHQRMAPKPPIERAASLFYYLHDDPNRFLIHNAKYNGRPQIMRYLGVRYAHTLMNEHFLDGIDMIEPVPMHWFKKLQRGYNQTDWLARGLSEVSGIPVGEHLCVSRRHSTQTHKSRMNRWLNASSSYTVVDADELAGLHILLVDDVITTGATITTCATLLSEAAPGVKVSVVSLGLTQLT